MKISGAIFDLDGTLLNSMYMWENIGRNYLIDLGISPENDINEKLKPLSLLQAAEYLRANYGIDKTNEEIIAGVTAKIAHFYTCEVKPKDGALNFVKSLREKGVKMCIATASDTGLVSAALRLCGMDEFFERIFTCTEVKSGKDSPKIYDTALEFLGTKKSETVIFEDAFHAAQTAKLAGYTVVGMYDDFEKENEEQMKRFTDKFIYSFDELRGYFD